MNSYYYSSAITEEYIDDYGAKRTSLNIVEGKVTAHSYTEAMAKLHTMIKPNGGRKWTKWVPCNLGYWIRAYDRKGEPHKDRIILYTNDEIREQRQIEF